MQRPPVEPPRTPWEFPSPERADQYGVVAVGADLEPGTILAAYRMGMFPMPLEGSKQVAWWSPDPRGVLELDELVVSRSLRRSIRRYHVSFNAAFEDVVEACANPARDGGWISANIIDAYVALHHLGWAHSVEVWDGAELVGGLYGVGIGGLFCGESMFHKKNDASKVALVALVDRLGSKGAGLVDVQWDTEHLRSLGVKTMSRSDYLVRVTSLTSQPHHASLSGSE